jgi:prepilin-type processing-associated H-X9-DG protein
LEIVPCEPGGHNWVLFGPWMFQEYGMWTRPGAVSTFDFYGHPGETGNLTYTDGHVSHESQPKSTSWKID